jgi:hypothetical protein
VHDCWTFRRRRDSRRSHTCRGGKIGSSGIFSRDAREMSAEKAVALSRVIIACIKCVSPSMTQYKNACVYQSR